MWSCHCSGGDYLGHRWCSQVREDTSSWTGWCQAGDTARSGCPSLGPHHSNTPTWSPGSCCWRSSGTDWSALRWSTCLRGYLERETKRRADPKINGGERTAAPGWDLAFRKPAGSAMLQDNCEFYITRRFFHWLPHLLANQTLIFRERWNCSKGLDCQETVDVTMNKRLDILHSRIHCVLLSKSSSTYRAYFNYKFVLFFCSNHTK